MTGRRTLVKKRNLRSKKKGSAYRNRHSKKNRRTYRNKQNKIHVRTYRKMRRNKNGGVGSEPSKLVSFFAMKRSERDEKVKADQAAAAAEAAAEREKMRQDILDKQLRRNELFPSKDRDNF